MYSTYDDRRRSGRDMPPRSSARYYDTVYAQPSSRATPRYTELDPTEPSSSAAYDRHHRRRSVDESAARSSRRTPKVVASDDGWGAHDTAAYPGRSSRHDVETKNGEGHRRFREKRGGYEVDEAQNLRRAKSYSPRRAAREAEDPRRSSPAQTAPKSSWGADEYTAAAAGAGVGAGAAGLHRSATTGKKSRAEQYYDDDPPRTGRGKARDRGYEYSTAAPAAPRPPIGDYSPYRTSPPSSSRDADEKLGGKQYRGHDSGRSRERGDKPYHSAGAYGQYDPPSVPEPPRRGRHAAADYPPAQPASSSSSSHPQPAPRTRHRADDYDDPYDRTSPSSRTSRPQRQSVPPPQARSRYADEYDQQDPYHTPPRRRATSMSHGGGAPGRGGYDAGPRAREREYYDDDERPGRRSTSGSGASAGRGGGAAAASGAYGDNRKDKGKKIGKQAGKLFMTHAFPVIKQEAVPFLTKAAQAYFEQKR